MLIELDKDKIKQEGIYSLKKMQKYIHDEIKAVGGRLDADGWYTDGTWEGFGAVASVLEKTEWFLRYAKTWLWRNTDYEDDGIEDLLQEVWETIKKIEPREAMNRIRNAADEEERRLYTFIVNANLQRSQKETIEKNLF